MKNEFTPKKLEINKSTCVLIKMFLIKRRWYRQSRQAKISNFYQVYPQKNKDGDKNECKMGKTSSPFAFLFTRM